jgi:hypothetical protein
MAMTETIEPEVVFNMDLANGRTSLRFCREASAVLDRPSSELDDMDEDYEFLDEVVNEWTSALESAGYAVRWDAGDVVVWDLRPLTDEQREEFYETLD